MAHPVIRPKSIHNPEVLEAYSSDYMYLGCVRFVKEVGATTNPRPMGWRWGLGRGRGRMHLCRLACEWDACTRVSACGVVSALIWDPGFKRWGAPARRPGAHFILLARLRPGFIRRAPPRPSGRSSAACGR